MKSLGTLDLRIEKKPFKGHDSKEEVQHWIITGPVPSMIMNRLIPDSYRMRRGECQCSDTMMNIQLINMLMFGYPLTITENARPHWEEQLAKMKLENERREKLEHLDFVEPDEQQFTGTLRQFQKAGLDFLQKIDANGLLADEMGLGKTIMSIAYIASNPKVYPVVIVAPLVVLQHWKKEIERFLRYDGKIISPRLVRSGEQRELRPNPIYLINYDLLQKRVMDLKALGPCTVIYDEIQKLRNTYTKRYRAALELTEGTTVKHVLGLSGTPVYNRVEEIWAIANLIRPGMLGTQTEFMTQHFEFDGMHYTPRDAAALYELLRQDFMLRRRKMEVLSELPEKFRVKEHLEVNKENYEYEVKKIFAALDKKLLGAKTAFERAKLERLFKQTMITQERQIAAVVKIPYVVKWVEACLDSCEDPVVVFFHHRITLDALRRYLVQYNPAMIVGGQTDGERQMEVERFQKGQTRLMFSGITAGNLGINLSKASIVVFAELDWVPAVHLQAEDRLHRIGQKNRVLAYYLIADGTLDEKIADILVDKTERLDPLLGDTPQEENTSEALKALDELRSRPAFRSLPKLSLVPKAMVNEPKKPELETDFSITKVSGDS